MPTNTKPTTKQRKTIEVVILAPYMVVLVLTCLTIGLVGGYFASINLHGQARQAVVADMAVASKTVEQK